MFERVLAPLDGSALAASVLPHVARIAPAGSQTLLLRVLEQNVEATLSDPLEWRMRRDVAEVYLDDVARRIGLDTGLQPVSRVEEGCAADRILAVAREWDAQLIALCSHGAGGLNAWNLNSVAFKVAQRTGTSLLLVRGYQFSSDSPDETLAPESYRRILVPMDGSLRAEHVLGAADAIASGTGATIVLARGGGPAGGHLGLAGQEVVPWHVLQHQQGGRAVEDEAGGEPPVGPVALPGLSVRADQNQVHPLVGGQCVQCGRGVAVPEHPHLGGRLQP